MGSGGVCYFPPGEYVVLTDASCQIERWDPTENVWASFIAASTGGFISVDGFNFRVHNITGVVSGNTLTAGSGMTNGIGPTATGVSVAYAASNTTGYPTATGYVIIGGSVAAPTVTQAGSGFLVPPPYRYRSAAAWRHSGHCHCGDDRGRLKWHRFDHHGQCGRRLCG